MDDKVKKRLMRKLKRRYKKLAQGEEDLKGVKRLRRAFKKLRDEP